MLTWHIKSLLPPSNQITTCHALSSTESPSTSVSNAKQDITSSQHPKTINSELRCCNTAVYSMDMKSYPTYRYLSEWEVRVWRLEEIPYHPLSKSVYAHAKDMSWLYDKLSCTLTQDLHRWDVVNQQNIKLAYTCDLDMNYYVNSPCARQDDVLQVTDEGQWKCVVKRYTAEELFNVFDGGIILKHKVLDTWFTVCQSGPFPKTKSTTRGK